MGTQRLRDPETESFAGLLLRYRGRTGLTQRDLAARLGTSRRSIQDWESGAYYPTAERLQALILVLLESGGLTAGREAVEVHELWAATMREAPRMHTPLDEMWLDGVLADRAAPRTEPIRDVKPAEAGSVERRQDWGEAPDDASARLAVLLQLLRDRPSLLVLDNFETVLEPGQHEGRYRDGFAGYGALLRAVGETRHQSCLVVTSREAPPELAVLGGSGVRKLQLGGLGVAEGQVLLADKQLSGNDEDWAELIGRFGGNGLALKVVGESIRQVLDGDIAAFLQQAGSSSIFGGIRRLLTEQIERSSALEQKLLRVLAVEREPVSLVDLIAHLGPRVNRGAV